jgi:hypothetical protein
MFMTPGRPARPTRAGPPSRLAPDVDLGPGGALTERFGI